LAPLREFVLYVAGSAAALALDTGVYTLGLHLGLPLLAAAFLGFILGMVFIYVVSTRHIFKQHRIADRQREFVIFALIGIAGLGLTELLLWLLVHRLGIAPVTGKLATAGAVFIFNFSLRRLMLFTRPASSHPSPHDSRTRSERTAEPGRRAGPGRGNHPAEALR
jgi:putative flippase GtrA